MRYPPGGMSFSTSLGARARDGRGPEPCPNAGPTYVPTRAEVQGQVPATLPGVTLHGGTVAPETQSAEGGPTS